MSTTATYVVNSPTSGTEYIAPSGYWVVPNNGTTVTTQVDTYDSGGNLLTVTTLTAYVRNVTGGTNAGSYSGNNSYGVASATGSGVNGSNVFAPAGKVVGSCAYLKMYMTYTGSAYDQPPNTPGITAPVSGATVTTQTPTFQATFSDPTSGDTLAQYQVQVENTSLAIVYDSGTVTASGSEISNAALSRVCGTSLSFGSSYSWRCRMANQNGLWSGYTSWISFNVVAGPNQASSITPSGAQTSTTPAWSFVYSHPSGTAMADYRILVKTSAGVTVYDTGKFAHSASNGSTVSGTIPGSAGLQAGSSYKISVDVWDTGNNESGFSSQVTFNINRAPTATLTSPINNVVVTTNTPTFQWSYADPGGYAQQSYQVQIINASTHATIKDTGVVSSAATSYTLSGASISYGTSIQWRVQVVDSAGTASGFTSYALAYVNNSPSATITAPTNGATIVTNTPSITWSYTASTGGQLQASAQVLLMDTSNNVLYTGSVSGAGTSLSLPSGLLVNGMTYHLQVTVTDTASNVGASSIFSFTLLYTAPADMQGQPLGAATNYIIGAPYLNVDDGSGRPTGWTGFQTSATFTPVIAIDPTVAQPINLANGDGPVYGAHELGVIASSASGFVLIVSHLDCFPGSGFTPNSTHLSLICNVIVQSLAGTPKAHVNITYQNSSFTTIRTDTGTLQTDTAGQIVSLLGPQNSLIPTNTAHAFIELEFDSPTSSDLGYAWFMDVQLEAAAASTANFIAGDLGTGYSYNGNNQSARALVAGGMPVLAANPGLPSDPVGAQGGTITLSWDITLADARFTSYLVERRRLDQQTNDAAWIQLASITSSAISYFVDFTAGGSVSYEYSIRQTIVYADGSNGISTNRAIVIGSVVFSPAWYFVNTQSQIVNWRLNYVQTKRTLAWKETAQYTPFLGRVGTARDAGAPGGFSIALVAYFDDAFGDVRAAIRRQLIAMQELNVVWNLKDPEGLVLPVYLQNFDGLEEDNTGDTLLSVTLNLLQAQDTPDY